MNGEINVVDPILLSKRFFYEDECEETVDDQKYSTVRTEIKQKIKKLVGDDSYFFELPSYNWGDQDFYAKDPSTICQDYSLFVILYKIIKNYPEFKESDIMIQIDESEVNGPLLHIYQLHKPLLNYEDFLHLCLEFLSKPCLLPPSSPFAPISLCPPLLNYDAKDKSWKRNESYSTISETMLVRLEEVFLDGYLMEMAKADHKSLLKLLGIHRGYSRLNKVVEDYCNQFRTLAKYEEYMGYLRDYIQTNKKQEEEMIELKNEEKKLRQEIEECQKMDAEKDSHQDPPKDQQQDSSDPVEEMKKEDSAPLTIQLPETPSPASISPPSPTTNEPVFHSLQDSILTEITNSIHFDEKPLKSPEISITNFHWNEQPQEKKPPFLFQYMKRKELFAFWRQENQRFIEYSQPFSYLNPFTGKSTQVPAIHLSGNDLVNNTLIVSQAPKSVSLHTIIQDALLRNNQSAAPNLTIMNEIYQSQFLNTTHKDANKIIMEEVRAIISNPRVNI